MRERECVNFLQEVAISTGSMPPPLPTRSMALLPFLRNLNIVIIGIVDIWFLTFVHFLGILGDAAPATYDGGNGGR